MAVKDFANPITNRQVAVPEQRLQRIHVVADKRRLIAREDGFDLGLHVRQIDLHHWSPNAGVSVRATPAVSSARAMRSAKSSRQAAVMICTPIGNPEDVGTGTATTGRPMKEMGWV